MTRILCIDDDDLTRATIVDLLKHAGFDTLEAGSGKGGLDVLMEDTPDLVICDISMPDLSGLEVLRRWREQREGDPTPFIFLSGLADRNNVLAGKRLGADDFLTKPVDSEILVQTIRTRLQNLTRALTERKRAAALHARHERRDADAGQLNGGESLGMSRTDRLSLQQRLGGVIASMYTRPLDPLTVMLVSIDEDGLSHEVNASEGEIAWPAGVELRIRATVDRFFGAAPAHRPYFVGCFQNNVFAVVLSDIDDRAAAGCVGREILRELGRPSDLPGRAGGPLAARIGIVWLPSQQVSPKEIIRRAGLVLKRCRADRNEPIHFYDEQWAEAWLRSQALSRDLKDALRNGQFLLEYQPRICLPEGRVDAVEALIRWQHPDRGRVAPNQFIPAVELHGLTVPLGEWVLGAACEQFRAWRDAAPVDFKVAVNIAPVHFGQPTFLPKISELLRRTGLEGEVLEIEVTESLMLSDLDSANRNLAGLKELGITVAIDDFGTGFSNLSYLQNFPANILKIDRTFVRNVPQNPLNSAIAKSMVELARLSGMRVVAEGIENEPELDFLRAVGCHGFQGFYFARPAHAEQLLEVLDSMTERYRPDSSPDIGFDSALPRRG